MLAKCYWKLHQRSDGRVSSIKAVQRCLTQAVELLPNPKRKDSTRDPIMEPIYKVIAVTHKLVAVRKELQASEGAAFIDEHLDLQNQIDASKRPKLFESSSWDVYVLNLLKMLRAADKSRWHHRPVLRAAGIMQDEEGSLREGALIAKEYLAEQHIFSAKTMAMNVWKPDNERPGRHHVYMTRYCLYLVKLLEATSDLEGIQLVAKRVRKKSGEFFEHEKLWTVVMGMHLTVSRIMIENMYFVLTSKYRCMNVTSTSNTIAQIGSSGTLTKIDSNRWPTRSMLGFSNLIIRHKRHTVRS